jgi:glyoxylate utilization-related uncharacterized protein
MTARLHRIADALAFAPAGHTGVAPVKLTGTTPDEFVSVVLSSYEPGAHAERSPVALDTVYLVLTGSLTVTLDDAEYELGHLDALFLPEGSVRAVDNRTGEPASMFVIRPNK